MSEAGTAWREIADAAADPAAGGNFPGGALGTPCRYWIDRRLPRLLADCRTGGPMRVLDLGCNDGAYLEAVRAAGITGEYVGIDIADSPRWAKRRRDGALRAEFRVHDAHAVADLEPRGFDLIVSITTLEHFEDDQKVLEGVASQLNPGGRFLAIVPSPYSVALLWKHGFRRYERKTTEARLRDLGLVVTAAHEVGGLSGFVLHTAWFNGSQAVTLLGKSVLRVMAGFDKARAKQLFGGLDDKLNRAMFVHQRFAVGRTVHAALNRGAARVDERLQALPALYAFVAEKRATGGPG